MSTDRRMPEPQDRGNRQFYTRRGFLNRHGLECGYVEIRGDDESGVRLEQISANGTLRVIGSGRWLRGEPIYLGRSLAAARKAFMAYDHLAATEAAKDQP